MKTLIVLALGIVIGIGVVWFLRDSRTGPPLEETSPPATNEVDRLRETWRERVGDLRTEEIKEELSRTGGVIRRKAREVGTTIADATSDVRITGTIKSRLALDSDLSALNVSVSTTDGIVTLSGTVSSYEHIGKAIDLALDVDGVREVISTLQVSARRDAK
jgi:hypothetical protein